MSATIIRFPGKKNCDASYLAFAYPPHWSDHQQYIFDHMVSDGRGVADAAAHIEAGIRDVKDAKALPTEREQLLFLARRAMSRMRAIGD